MSQRDSGYARKERDLYETPEWATEAVIKHLPKRTRVWEPACGSGKMLAVLSRYGPAYGTDIEHGTDFFHFPPLPDIDAIITNPPYEAGTEFIERSLRLMEPVNGSVAMLMRTDFDHAKTRSHLFRECPAFAKKLVLTRRIKWFEGPMPCKHCNATGSTGGAKCKPCNGKGEKEQGPSENHAWFIWDWRNEGAPTLAYGP